MSAYMVSNKQINMIATLADGCGHEHPTEWEPDFVARVLFLQNARSVIARYGEERGAAMVGDAIEYKRTPPAGIANAVALHKLIDNLEYQCCETHGYDRKDLTEAEIEWFTMVTRPDYVRVMYPELRMACVPSGFFRGDVGKGQESIDAIALLAKRMLQVLRTVALESSKEWEAAPWGL